MPETPVEDAVKASWRPWSATGRDVGGAWKIARKRRHHKMEQPS